jgi:anti-anti-sigma regulatory factor
MGPDDRSARTLPVDAAGLDADALTLDALARLQLAARRCGFQLCLRGSSPELRELIGFAGLDEVLPDESELQLGLEPRR